jgi:hypothetical protein
LERFTSQSIGGVLAIEASIDMEAGPGLPPFGPGPFHMGYTGMRLVKIAGR